MILSCYIVDDEPHAITVLENYIHKTPGLALMGTSLNPLEALPKMTGGTAPDLTFLDVDMPELSGLDLAAMVRSVTTVIFTTSYREYAADAFEKDAADYLLKPFSYERFLLSVQKVRSKLNVSPASGSYFFIKSDVKGKMIKVPTAEIRYISSMANYVEIHLSKEKLIAYLTMQEILEMLPPGQFYRIQKSVIVAPAFIHSVEQSQVRLDDQTLLPIGLQYKDAFLAAVQSLLLVSKRKRSS